MNEEYLLNHGTDKPIQIEISNVLGAELDGLSIEMDEMWSFVTTNPSRYGCGGQ